MYNFELKILETKTPDLEIQRFRKSIKEIRILMGKLKR
jgi:hypothetical protein